MKVSPLGSASDRHSGAADMTVSIPSFRRDLKLEVDLIEEIARLYGYENMPRKGQFRGGRSQPRRQWDQIQVQARHYLATVGYHEITTSSFFEGADLDRLQLAETDPRRQCLQVINPHHGGGTLLRTSLLPSLLRGFRHNINVGNKLPIKLFQVGKLFLPAGPHTQTGRHPDEGLLPPEPVLLQFGLAGRTDGGLGNLSADLLELKGVLQVLAQLLRLPLHLEPGGKESYLNPQGQWRILTKEERPVGSAGALREAVLKAYAVDLPVSVAEIDLTQVTLSGDLVSFKPFSRFPAVKRDLSLLVPIGVRFADLKAVVQKSGGELLESLDLFDFYGGKGIETGKNALGIRLKFRSDKGNLKGRVVDQTIATIERALAELLDVHIRS
jgi:phenylalanyl-tRNA synthetase beta chain